jgi:hypothetical protein
MSVVHCAIYTLAPRTAIATAMVPSIIVSLQLPVFATQYSKLPVFQQWRAACQKHLLQLIPLTSGGGTEVGVCDLLLLRRRRCCLRRSCDCLCCELLRCPPCCSTVLRQLAMAATGFTAAFFASRLCARRRCSH